MLPEIAAQSQSGHHGSRWFVVGRIIYRERGFLNVQKFGSRTSFGRTLQCNSQRRQASRMLRERPTQANNFQSILSHLGCASSFLYRNLLRTLSSLEITLARRQAFVRPILLARFHRHSTTPRLLRVRSIAPADVCSDENASWRACF